MLINAAKDVASALSHLINSAKNASGKQGSDPAMELLKESAKVSSYLLCGVYLRFLIMNYISDCCVNFKIIFLLCYFYKLTLCTIPDNFEVYKFTAETFKMCCFWQPLFVFSNHYL